MNTESRFLKYSLVGLSAVAFGAAIAACSTTDAGGAGGAGSGGDGSSSGGSLGVAGTGTTVAGSTSVAGTTTGTGGSTTVGTGGSGGAVAAGMGVACPTPTAAMAALTDFSPLDGGAASTGSWGDFSTIFSGSAYDYPNGTAMYALTSDMSMGNWHMTGMVGDYSGFGLSFNNCNKVDLSAFSGISFTISGTAPSPIAASANIVTLTVGTAGDDVASTWLNTHKSRHRSRRRGQLRSLHASQQSVRRHLWLTHLQGHADHHADSSDRQVDRSDRRQAERLGYAKRDHVHLLGSPEPRAARSEPRP